MRSAAWIVATALIFGLVAVRETNAQSVGFFPAAIELESALRGQEYQTRTTLVNQTGEPRIFSLRALGDTAPWTRFSLPEAPDEAVVQVSVPAATDIELLVTVAIPQSAPNGDMAGKNSYDGYTQAAFENREGVVTGFEQPVRVKVTGDQVIDLRVGDVSARDVEVGQPLTVLTQLTNQGNVDTASHLTIDLFPIPGDATGASVETLSTELDPIPPGQSRTQPSEWDTADMEAGQYRADYVVSRDGDRLALGSFEFELKPAGSVVPEGIVVAVDIVRPLMGGAVNRADITFENTGDMPVRAQFSGHLYHESIALGEAKTPDSLDVSPGERVVLSAYFDLPEGKADYELRGRAYFEGVQTDEVAVPFAVGASGERTITGWLALAGGAVAGLGVLVMTGAWAIRRGE